MLNSTGHEISTAHKNENTEKLRSFWLKVSQMLYYHTYKINVKMPTIVGILTFMSRINCMLSSVGHERGFIHRDKESGVYF